MIKFFDLKKVNQPYEKAFHEKLEQFMQRGWYILGDEVKLFEENFANYCQSKHCIGVGNGLDALVLIFKAYIELGKLQKGDEVIIPANTYIASVLSILQADLVPILVEPKLETFNLNPNLIVEKITSKTKAILVVHLYGQLAEMDKIDAIAKQNNLLIIQDAAQSHGVHIPSPIAHHPSAYSFYPSKNLGCLGDGGAVVTNDHELSRVIKAMRNYGSEKKYVNDFIGINSRLDEIQAAFLNVKLDDLDQDNQKRREIANRYLTEIRNDKIVLPFYDGSANHVFHLFVIRTENRNELQEYLNEKGIETMIHYPIPPHQQKALAAFSSLSFPITEKIHREVLSLPMSPVLTREEVSHVIQVINRY
ncbi:MAG TPA: DegT/DnrJ/EryC1/StrS family aminotransferase [Flavobacterium sp.]|uniref:DegT/DnrJ/EryC1/StrS family aminotransferase n=1 Tax=unclassified Flavobacterium TaxID=196869 RepID=UPI0025BBAED1|nr:MULTISPECIES: DegT/DnrJ/EryC1/StrS family aminotransferase [unclassified Flavobacterium]HRE77016.1 DegT/DnrJ/EryC1/StrS family aminotransferase [Flavobacterium sp.]